MRCFGLLTRSLKTLASRAAKLMEGHVGAWKLITWILGTIAEQHDTMLVRTGAGIVAVIGLCQPENYIDVRLRGLGVERRIGLTVPTYVQALRMAALTDLVAFALFAMGNHEIMTMTGLWEPWKSPDDGQWLRSCTNITTDANDLRSMVW